MAERCSVEGCENLAVFDTGLCLEDAAPDPETADNMDRARGYRLDGSRIARWIQVDPSSITRFGDLDE